MYCEKSVIVTLLPFGYPTVLQYPISTEKPHDHSNLQVHREEMLIFMEYCPEGSLEELVSNTDAGLEETLIRRYTRQLLEAVVCLHEHGVVHRSDQKTVALL